MQGMRMKRRYVCLTRMLFINRFFLATFYTSSLQKFVYIIKTPHSFHYRRQLNIPLNYAIFLYKNGDRSKASQQFTTFEHRLREAESKTVKEVDPDVSSVDLFIGYQLNHCVLEKSMLFSDKIG